MSILNVKKEVRRLGLKWILFLYTLKNKNFKSTKISLL